MGNEPAKRFEWERIIRRVYMDPSTKLVALVLATYANKDGTQVRPGRKRLAAVTCLSVRTVDRHLDELRSLNFLDRMAKGSNTGTRDLADVYRLTIPTDLLDTTDLLPPSEIGEQSSPMTSGQSSPMTTGEAEAVDTHDEAVDTHDYYQSSPMTQPVDTGDYLPDQVPPSDQIKHHSAATQRIDAPPTKACGCIQGWFDHDAGASPCKACRPDAYRRLHYQDADDTWAAS